MLLLQELAFAEIAQINKTSKSSCEERQQRQFIGSKSVCHKIKTQDAGGGGAAVVSKLSIRMGRTSSATMNYLEFVLILYFCGLFGKLKEIKSKFRNSTD